MARVQPLQRGATWAIIGQIPTLASKVPMRAWSTVTAMSAAQTSE